MGTAGATNRGHVAGVAGDVENASAINGRSYDIVFHKDGGGTAFDIVSTDGGAVVSRGNAFTSGAQVSVADMRVKLTGQLGEGDRIWLAPSQPRNAFAALEETIAAGINQIDHASQKA